MEAQTSAHSRAAQSDVVADRPPGGDLRDVVAMPIGTTNATIERTSGAANAKGA